MVCKINMNLLCIILNDYGNLSTGRKIPAHVNFLSLIQYCITVYIIYN